MSGDRSYYACGCYTVQVYDCYAGVYDREMSNETTCEHHTNIKNAHDVKVAKLKNELKAFEANINTKIIALNRQYRLDTKRVNSLKRTREWRISEMEKKIKKLKSEDE